jgi:Zn-dependent metalloprotease
MLATHWLLPLAVVATLCARPACAAPAAPAVARAQSLLPAHATEIRLAAADRFVARDALLDADGSEHVRFDRTYAGLPVLGGDVVVHSRHGRFLSASLTQGAALDLDTRPALAPADAVVAAGVEFGSGFTGDAQARLVVDARGPGPAVLAWQVRLHDAGTDMTYVVDARDGTVRARWSNRETAAATGHGRTLYSGAVTLTTDATATGFALRDPSRGNGFALDASNSRTSGQVYADADNTWGDYAVTDAATAAADAQYGAARTWDYYRNVHGRTGIGDDGRGATSRLHYGRRYSNAFWQDACFCMTYGDGDGVNVGPLVSLDIAAHEMSHGVNARTANLFYDGESGGLNEANSDIFAAMVEFYANSAQDTPDYLVGEQVFLANVAGSADQRALRYMFDPARDGRSPACWSPTLGALDVHYSSGVANLFFYLLAEGTAAKSFSGVDHTPATCNGAVFGGVGRGKARLIWYRALTVYFTSATDYHGARVATLQAAADLYGATSAERARVAAAWNAVDVH